MAQINLAALHAEGIGISPDPVKAYAWFVLAGEHNPKAQEAAQSLATDLTASQQREADSLIKAIRAEFNGVTPNPSGSQDSH